MIAPGAVGRCRVRRNRGGRLIAETWNRPAALQVDPIEKKPLACYRPGSRTFSIGTFGCNLRCAFCQNDQLSRHGLEAAPDLPEVSAQELIALARRYGCESVALTYNEPTVAFEYALEIARTARAAGLGTVLVSNGFIAEEPRRELYALIDAANIDLKGPDSFYRRYCGGTLEPVLAGCRSFRNDFDGHLELTTLLIPGLNDAEPELLELLERVAGELGTEVPLHFSAYFPAGGFTAPPTPPETLYRARSLARRCGFRCVRLGNLPFTPDPEET